MEDLIDGKPIINEFVASETAVKNGEKFTLSWNVENADRLELHKNGKIIKLDINRKSIELMGVLEENSYLLVAYNKLEVTKSRPIIVGPPHPDPVIIQFYADKETVKNNEPFTLMWEVENAVKIVLHKDNEPIELDIEQNTAVLRGDFKDSRKESSYILVADNNHAKTKSDPIIIYQMAEPEPEPDPVPVIRQFVGSKTEIKKGERITLNWEVENADRIELYKNDKLIELDVEQKVIDQTVFFDDDRQTSIYTLVVYKGNNKVRSNPVIVSLMPEPLLKPVIKNFIANKTNLKNQEEFTLSWDVENASKIELHRDGVLVEKFSADQKNISLKADFPGDKNALSYVLVAGNNDLQTKSSPVIIGLNPVPIPPKPKPPILIASIAFAAVVICILVYILINHTHKPVFRVTETQINEGKDFIIETKNLSNTDNLHVYFDGVEANEKTLVGESLTVKVPHCYVSSSGDGATLAIIYQDNRLYQIRLPYIKAKRFIRHL